MPLFSLKSAVTKITLIVRTKCLSCAREIAVKEVGAEGTMVWRDPSSSIIELIRPDDKAGLILRGAKYNG